MEGIKLITRKEVAEIFKVSERTVINWEKSKSITASKIGRTVRYLESEVRAILNTSTAKH